MSLLADYFKEHGTKEVVESDKGFATYYFIEDGCYVEDIYVRPEFRREGIATQMLDSIAEIAKAKGYKRLLGSCIPNVDGSTDRLQAAFDYGFKLISSKENFIFYGKGI